MSKDPTNHLPDPDTYQQSDETELGSTNKSTIGAQQQNGHVPNLVNNAKIENFSSPASSVEELAKVPDVKVSNIIGNFKLNFPIFAKLV